MGSFYLYKPMLSICNIVFLIALLYNSFLLFVSLRKAVVVYNSGIICVSLSLCKIRYSD